MKLSEFYVLCLMAFLLMGCQESIEYKDVILFTGTESSPVVKFSVESPSSFGLTVSATNKVTEDTRVSVRVNMDLLSSYNAKYGRTYIAPPEDSYKLESEELVIKAGQNISDAIRFSVTSVNNFKEGQIYCVPVSMVSTNGSMPILEASRTVYVVLLKPTITKVLNLGGEPAFNVPKFITDERVSSLNAITMEARVKANSWSTGNPYISTVMGIEENYLLRFGDISLNRGDVLQMGPAKLGDEKLFVNSTTVFKTDVWYHVASVYDGSSLSIYVNGKLDASVAVGGGSVNLNDDYCDGFWIGRSSVMGRLLDGSVSEVRVWNRALSPGELEDYACAVDPKASGLLAYWKFNTFQEDGATVRDETGNGFDAKLFGSGYTWVENVRCPAE